MANLFDYGFGGLLGMLAQHVPWGAFTALTVAVENGFLVASLRLEPYQVTRMKGMRAFLRARPPTGEDWKGEETEPETETVTCHRLRWTTVFCLTLDAVRAAHEIANAEREKIKAWMRDREGKENGPGDYIVGSV